MASLTTKIADLLRAFRGKSKDRPCASAIIVAAGNSTRIGGTVSKQLRTVDSLPVIAHTLLAFENCEEIGEIIIVARESERDVFGEICKEHKITKLAAIVEGGDTRQASVKNGFKATNPDFELVAIHDGARCLTTPKNIEDVCLSAYKHGAAIAATQAIDTIKLESRSNYIGETLDRSKIWLAQTPQVFKRNVYRAAIAVADDENFFGTDDASLVEHIGYKVKLVECGRDNIKVTTPDDIERAAQIIQSRKLKKESDL